MKNGSVMGKCWDSYGNHLQLKKSESRDGFRKLGVTSKKS